MATGRPKTPLTLTDDERTQLRSFARSRTLPHALVARAKLVLWSSEGESNSQIAARLHWTKATVGKWRQRFLQYRLAGLYDKLRPGRPRIAALEDRKRLAFARYVGGVDTQLNALDADRDLLQAQLNLRQLRLNELLSVVQLYKALGGGWQ